MSNDVGRTSNFLFGNLVLKNLLETRHYSFVDFDIGKTPHMNRERQYKQLADDMFRRASEEKSMELKAQWEILGARYLEIARQSGGAGDKELSGDSVKSEFWSSD